MGLDAWIKCHNVHDVYMPLRGDSRHMNIPNIPYQGVGALGAAPYIINASRMIIIWPWNVIVWLHHCSVHIPPTNFHAGKKLPKIAGFGRCRQ